MAMTIPSQRLGVALAIVLTAAGCGTLNRLHRAISENDVARVAELLERGANANNYVYYYGHPLSHAAGECHTDIARLLLDHGARTSDNVAELSLRRAVGSCDAKVVELLLQRGIDPNANFYLGGTILMYAVERADLQILSLLLHHGADPNVAGRYDRWVQAKPGESYPLMMASKLGQIASVQVLLSHGADVAARDVFGVTALSAAEHEGHTHVVSLLRAHGAI